MHPTGKLPDPGSATLNDGPMKSAQVISTSLVRHAGSDVLRQFADTGRERPYQFDSVHKRSPSSMGKSHSASGGGSGSEMIHDTTNP